MTSHVATGILALLCAMLHGAMAPGDTVDGHAFLALTVLLVTGAIGRYFYAYVPRAANGRELELSEVKQRQTVPVAQIQAPPHYVETNSTPSECEFAPFRPSQSSSAAKGRVR